MEDAEVKDYSHSCKLWKIIMPATYLVTGTSSGIGLDLVKTLAARGDKVYATVRQSRGSSMTGEDQLSSVAGDVTVIENVDVSDDNVGSVLKKALDGITIDVVIHNAGSVNATRELKGGDIFAEQKLGKINYKTMLRTFDTNCVGILRVQEAVNDQIRSPGGKIVLLSTGMGSIADNGSGGVYAYRCSKAAMNMVAKGLSCDLKEKQICVCPIAPGMVTTEFGMGSQAMSSFGAAPVSQATKGILDILETKMGMDGTGVYWMIPTSGDPPKVMPW
ncbi:unnamed protein product [Amoebophrya sp. A120]|nr:unnamed protein product [Amoebophrya sp. A120]|eukprot:GSA120T00016587001.1